MYKLVALCLFLAVASAKFQDTKTVLAQMESHPFGKTMVSLVGLNVAAKAPMDDITVIIDQILSELESDQTEADKLNVTNQADCDDTISNLEGQIAQLTVSIAQLEKTIEDNEAILSQARIDLKQAETDYDETVQAIEVGTAERQAAHEKWANEDYDMTIQITTLDEGTKLINHMLHGVAFSQIQTRYEKVLSNLKESKGNHASLFKPLVTSLTQLATKLNYENVMNILNLLADIRSSIVSAQTEARNAEEAAQAEWEAALKILEAQKKALADKKTRLAALIKSTEQILTQSRQSLEINRVNLENAKAALAEKQDQCAGWSSVYIAESAEREREIEILEQLREHLIEKGEQVAAYMADRAANAPGF